MSRWNLCSGTLLIDRIYFKYDERYVSSNLICKIISDKREEIKPEVAVPEVAAVENGNKIIEEPSEIKETTAESADTTPKTNGNSSHR